MKHCVESCSARSTSDSWMLQPGPRFPDMRHQLKIRWRDALRQLLAPAERMHRYHRLRAEFIDIAIREMDRSAEQRRNKLSRS